MSKICPCCERFVLSLLPVGWDGELICGDCETAQDAEAFAADAAADRVDGVA